MAWELQRHMHGLVAPSIDKAARSQPYPKSWAAVKYADQRWDEATGNAGYDGLLEHAESMEYDTLVEEVANRAIQNSSTTNGGHEVYLDGWTSVPWCSDDEQLIWYENRGFGTDNFQTLRKEES